MNYAEFLDEKRQLGGNHGFKPVWMLDKLFDFQQQLVEWSLQRGRSALYENCGLGKTPQQLTWAENVVRKTKKPVLILAPLAVSHQTCREGEKFGIEVQNRREGKEKNDRLVVTNYERLHHFTSSDYGGVVCDESSCIKHADSATRAEVTAFMRKIPYRLLCTATPSPNDYIELGTSSEALGEMGFVDMVSRFFKKAKSTLSRKDEFRSGVYKFRGHSEHDFWRWVCSWARAIRAPSDMGCNDDGFRLPPLHVNEHKVTAKRPAEGMLFDVPAINLHEQRDELKRTVHERCEMAASLINKHTQPAIAWCHLNEEGKLLAKLIPDSVEVAGCHSDDVKEARLLDFTAGKSRVLVSKPSIAGWGMNWQHCAHATYFPSYSYESYYQAVRRCWRFGQKRDVTVDVISTEGQYNVLGSLNHKSDKADEMFSKLVELMWKELRIVRKDDYTQQEEVPAWL